MLYSSIIVGSLTFLSRVFGLVRELFIAALFGCSPIADSINIAWKLPNLFRRILGEGSLSSVFIPIFSNRMMESKEEGEKFINQVYNILLIVLVLLVILLEIFMPQFLIVLVPGFKHNAPHLEMTILLCRITIPYLFCISQVTLLGAILNSVNCFTAISFVPIILNVGIIFFTLLLKNYINSAQAISYSLIISGIFQLIFMYICFRNRGFRLCTVIFPFGFNNHLKKFFYDMGPSILSSGIVQLQLFISQSIASFIPGSIAILNYAERIYQFPLSIIGTTLSTILLPTLTRNYQNHDEKNIFFLNEQIIKFGLLLSFPCSIGLIVLSQPIIHVIYERGMFTITDTMNVANTMKIFALGLPAFILVKILTTIFYAKQDVITPFKLSIVTLSTNTILNIVFMHYYGYIGLVAGSVITSWLHLILLFIFIYNKTRFFLSQKAILTLSIIFIMNVIIGIILDYCFQNFVKEYFFYSSLILKIFMLLGIILIIGGSYLLALFKFIKIR